jgi:hypothetical protein
MNRLMSAVEPPVEPPVERIPVQRMPVEQMPVERMPVERMPAERVELTVQSRQDQPSLSERHRYREALEQGEKLARLKRDRGKRRENRIREPREQQVQTWIKTLDHKIRWYILQFHTNNGVEKVIDEITNDLSHDTLAFERLRTKAMDMVKNIKHRTTNSLQV